MCISYLLLLTFVYVISSFMLRRVKEYLAISFQLFGFQNKYDNFSFSSQSFLLFDGGV